MKHPFRSGIGLLVALALLCPHLTVPAAAQEATRPLVQPAPAALCAELRTSFLSDSPLSILSEIFMRDIAPPRAEPTTPQQTFNCLLYGGLFYQASGNSAEALEAFYAASHVLTHNDLGTMSDSPDLAWGLAFIIGSNLMSQGRTAEGVAELNSALALADPAETPDPWTSDELRMLALASTHNNLGVALAAADSRGEPIGITATESITTHFTVALDVLQAFSLDTQSEAPATGLGQRILGGKRIVGNGNVRERLLDRVQNSSEPAVGANAGLIELLLERAVGRLTTNLARSIEPLVLNNLGETYRRQGEFEQAETFFEQGLERIETLRAENGASTNALRNTPQNQVAVSDMLDAAEGILHNNMGLLHIDRADYAEAIDSFTRALNLLDARQQDLFTLSVYSNLGWIYHQQGHLAQTSGEAETAEAHLENALTHYETALALLETERAAMERMVTNFTTAGNVGTLEVLNTGGVLNQHADLYAQLTSLYVQGGEPEKAFAAAERGRARLFLDMLATGQFVVPDEALLTAVQDADTRIRMFERALAQIQAGDRPRPLIQPVIEQQLDQAEENYHAALTSLQSHYPQLAALLPGTDITLDVSTLQTELLADDTTLLVYYTNDSKLAETSGLQAVAWVIETERLEMVELDGFDGDLGRSVQFLRNSIENRKFDTSAAQQLYAQLIAPLVPHISNEKLLIVPHHHLHYLPFAALHDAEADEYLIEQYTLSYAPSASALQFMQANRNQPGDRALVMGNADNSLPPAEAEAAAVAALYGTEAFTRTAASESTLRTGIESADLVHLAVHGTLNELDPLASHVALAAAAPLSATTALTVGAALSTSVSTAPELADTEDGTLTVREVFGLELSNADLVVLSACQTGLGENGRGDEVVGLTRAFLYAGTPEIITTLWSINDSAATDLMVTLHERRQEGMSTAAALRQAQLDTLAETDYSDPYYWAAFVLHGYDAPPSEEAPTAGSTATD